MIRLWPVPSHSPHSLRSLYPLHALHPSPLHTLPPLPLPAPRPPRQRPPTPPLSPLLPFPPPPPLPPTPPLPPLPPRVSPRTARKGEWAHWGLNPGPPACWAGVIPLDQMALATWRKNILKSSGFLCFGVWLVVLCGPRWERTSSTAPRLLPTSSPSYPYSPSFRLTSSVLPAKVNKRA